MIRFLVDTVSSLTDVNGNRYHFATITSTKSREIVRVKDIGGENNARALVRKFTGAEFSEIYSTRAELKIRDFDHALAFHDAGAKFEHEITAADFADF